MLLVNQTSSLSPGLAATISTTTFEGSAITFRAADISAVQDLPALPKSTVYAGARAQIFSGLHTTIVRDTAKNIQALIDAAGALAARPFTGFIHVEDQKAQNTAGGTFTNGAWRTRDLNTEVSDVDGLASLSTNQLTLQPGIWVIEASAPAFNVGRHQTRLQDLTAGSPGTTLKVGEGAVSAAANQTRSSLVYRGSFSAAVILELQHQCANTVATNGFGALNNFTTEVFSVLKAWKIGEA